MKRDGVVREREKFKAANQNNNETTLQKTDHNSLEGVGDHPQPLQ